MSITQTASRVRIESAAKNGTLGTQGAINADQIKFDTAMTTNNGNTMASPVFRRRHVTIRRGDADEECGLVQSVEGDGVTCNMFNEWDEVPVSGDTYDVSYRLEDVATIAGCDFETDSRQWVMTKRLIVGVSTTTFGYLGLSHGQVLRLNDEGVTNSALRINAAGRFEIGTLKLLATGVEKSERGGTLIFLNSTDDELVMDFNGAATGRMFEFNLTAAYGPEGVTGLQVTVSGTADVIWGRAQTHGMNAPFGKTVNRFKDIKSINYGTKADLAASAWWNSWLESEMDASITDALSAEASSTKVRLLVEAA